MPADCVDGVERSDSAELVIVSHAKIVIRFNRILPSDHENRVRAQDTGAQIAFGGSFTGRYGNVVAMTGDGVTMARR
jgi:hypothetical protein